MTTPNPNPTRRRTRIARAGTALALAGTLGLAACSSGNNNAATSSTTSAPASSQTSTGTGTDTAGQVLPVTSNPISNDATAADLHIDSVLVENNEDGNGNAVDDHLEIAVSNSGTTDLSGFEVFYTITDPTAGTSESYYADLGPNFTVPAGGSRVIHFDNTGAPDHFPVNDYSLYYSSVNALDVEVQVSAQGAAVQTATVAKDAGGAEVPD